MSLAAQVKDYQAWKGGERARLLRVLRGSLLKRLEREDILLLVAAYVGEAPHPRCTICNEKPRLASQRRWPMDTSVARLP